MRHCPTIEVKAVSIKPPSVTWIFVELFWIRHLDEGLALRGWVASVQSPVIRNENSRGGGGSKRRFKRYAYASQKPSLPLKSGNPLSTPKPAPATMNIRDAFWTILAARSIAVVISIRERLCNHVLSLNIQLRKERSKATTRAVKSSDPARSLD